MFRLLSRRRRAPAARPLLQCASCRADAVCPMSWDESGEDFWLIHFRCGQCGRRDSVLVANADAAALDVELDRRQAQIAAAADAIAAERMAADVEVFAAALQLDLIDAGDFAPSQARR